MGRKNEKKKETNLFLFWDFMMIDVSFGARQQYKVFYIRILWAPIQTW